MYKTELLYKTAQFNGCNQNSKYYQWHDKQNLFIFTRSRRTFSDIKKGNATHILSYHLLTPESSWKAMDSEQYLANELCLRNKEICSGLHRLHHLGFLY